jgi:tetratricopeptide (TPR) repeat protein
MALEQGRVKPGERARKQRPLSRKAKIIGLAAGILLVWRISAVSLAAGHSDSSNDLAAADFAGASQAAAITAAEQRLGDGDFAGAKVFSTHALSISAISAASLRNLGLAEQGLGNWQRSGALFSQNAALGWRDAPTQLWLVQAFLQQKDYDTAAQRMDAVLRLNPPNFDLYGTLDQLIGDPAFARAMAGRLLLNPDWRTYYLGYVSNLNGPALLARAHLLSLLSGSAMPPSREEVLPILSVLIRDDKAPLARMLWTRSQRTDSKGIFDPGFTNAGTTGMAPFEWSILPVPGATLTREQQGAANIVHVTTDGAASGILLRQATALPPGPHRLSFAGTIPPAAHHAFGWSVRCRSGRILLNTTGLAGPSAYRFDVPQDCLSQQVELLVASSAEAAGKEALFKAIDVD